MVGGRDEMTIDSYFQKRKDAGWSGAGGSGRKRAVQPRKRYRRRGPGLLTSDTDLQRRLTQLMQDANPEELLFAATEPEGKMSRHTDDEDAQEIPFDPKMLERLPAKPQDEPEPAKAKKVDSETAAAEPSEVVVVSEATGSGSTTTRSKQGNTEKAKSAVKEKSADLLVFQSTRGLTEGTLPGVRKRRNPAGKGLARGKDDNIVASMPAFLRRRVSGRASIARLFRRRHLRMYHRLLYDVPKREEDGLQETDDGAAEEEEEGDDERHGALGILLGAAEAMHKQERRSS